TGGKTTTSQGGATGSQGGATGSQGGATGSQGGATGSQGGATGQGGTTGQGGSTGDAGGGLPICNPAPADKSGCQGTEATCTKNCGPNVADLNMGRPQKACACTGPATTTAPISPASWDCSNAGPCTWPPALAAVDCFHLPTTLTNCPMDTADGGNALIRPNASNCTLPAGTTCGLTCG